MIVALIRCAAWLLCLRAEEVRQRAGMFGSRTPATGLALRLSAVSVFPVLRDIPSGGFKITGSKYYG
ncbi:hypothetical protein SAMN02910291_01578 [Desulfovibrio desulfuricans]|uniref:Uncharacterized protein n=3 Tax=Desulfovibrio TaxID=872 RepID=A0AA94HSZ6_DESDE|nr:hypothetical protein CNY67_10455 [Desulfovibrio sp. G11]SFW50197.1 hypothetical protein SAMN02910291_01578 [Desulfovibrio desulfuricans]SPD34482.1 Hypothetical protein DSVG11_0357 [Desulfovibrio sp. G11]